MVLNCRGRLLNLTHPVVMGILNVTPDSFYDGGKFNDVSHILMHVGKMLEEGAAMIDVGAASSRPGASAVSEKEERERLLPVIKAIIHSFPQAIISVDTANVAIASEALNAGASVVNDITAQCGPMAELAAAANAPYIVMHMQGSPATMQLNPQYENVTLEVLEFLVEKIKQACSAGVKDVIIDPGFGFGKDLSHNFELLRGLSAFKITGCPVLAGISRKSMINKVLKTKPETALNGTTALHAAAIMNGADILRAHDVKEAVEVIQLMQYLK